MVQTKPWFVLLTQFHNFLVAVGSSTTKWQFPTVEAFNRFTGWGGKGWGYPGYAFGTPRGGRKLWVWFGGGSTAVQKGEHEGLLTP